MQPGQTAAPERTSSAAAAAAAGSSGWAAAATVSARSGRRCTSEPVRMPAAPARAAGAARRSAACTRGAAAAAGARAAAAVLEQRSAILLSCWPTVQMRRASCICRKRPKGGLEDSGPSCNRRARQQPDIFTTASARCLAKTPTRRRTCWWHGRLRRKTQPLAVQGVPQERSFHPRKRWGLRQAPMHVDPRCGCQAASPRRMRRCGRPAPLLNRAQQRHSCPFTGPDPPLFQPQ